MEVGTVLSCETPNKKKCSSKNGLERVSRQFGDGGRSIPVAMLILSKFLTSPLRR